MIAPPPDCPLLIAPPPDRPLLITPPPDRPRYVRSRLTPSALTPLAGRELGDSPKPPRLFPPLCMFEVTLTHSEYELKVMKVVDVLFSFSTNPPPMLRDYVSLSKSVDPRAFRCNIRPAVDAAFASMVMYYPDRSKPPIRCSGILARMRDALVAGGICTRDKTHETLIMWSGVIAADFKERNSLTSIAEGDASGYLRLSESLTTQAQMMRTLMQKLQQVPRDVGTLVSELLQRMQHLQCSAGGEALLGEDDGEASLLQSPLAAPMPIDAMERDAEEAEEAENDVTKGLQLPGSSDANSLETAERLAGVDSNVLFEWIKQNQGNIPPMLKTDGEKNRARLVKITFEAMATADELSILEDRNSERGDRLKTALRLMNLVRALLAERHKLLVDAGKLVDGKGKVLKFPPSLAAGKILKVSSVEDRFNTLKKLDLEFLQPVDSGTCERFRQQHESSVLRSPANKRMRPESIGGGGSSISGAAGSSSSGAPPR